MKIVQSFFSSFLNDKHKLMHASYCMLSSIYGKSSDLPITLYCDYEFKQILEKSHHKEIIEIEEFKNPLDFLNIHQSIWAWPKFIVLDRVSRDTIHIDCDVFLKDKNCAKLLEVPDNGVLCQHRERLDFLEIKNSYTNSYETVSHLEFPDFIKKESPKTMPNNGILVVNNETLWNEYRDLYWNMVEAYSKNPGPVLEYAYPDLIFEQYFLEQLCDNKYNINIKYAFPQENFDDIFQSAVDNNYQHMCGEKMDNLNKCIELIKKKDIIAWESLKSYFGEQFPEYFN